MKMRFLTGLSALGLVVCFVLILTGAAPASAAETLTLKVYEGYNFASHAVMKSGDPKADISFYVNTGRRGAMSFQLGAIGAKRLKECGKAKPNASVLQNRAQWGNSANAPSAGDYFALEGADGKSLYLVKIIGFENQGKASSYWQLTLSWEKL